MSFVWKRIGMEAFTRYPQTNNIDDCDIYIVVHLLNTTKSRTFLFSEYPNFGRFSVTAKFICVFVFAYPNHWFSHDDAHIILCGIYDAMCKRCLGDRLK